MPKDVTCQKTFEGLQTLMIQSSKVCELALKASYQVALRVVQIKQSYIIAESLILPTARDMCKTMFGKDEYVKKTEKHPNARPIELNWQLMLGHYKSYKLPKADYFAMLLDYT